MSSEKDLTEYDPEDGYRENGVDQCPRCNTALSPNGGKVGPVYQADGTKHEHILDTDPMDRPFFCEDCFKALETVKKAESHKTLGEFSQ